MKRNIHRTFLIATVLTTAMLSGDARAAKPVDRAGEGQNRGCSNATLQGDYGRLTTGVRIVVGGATESFVGTALRTYDGNGGFTEVANSHGQITGTERDLPKTGTYHVNPDCTGSATMLIRNFPPVETSFVIVDRGREIDHAVMSPAAQLATGVERRVSMNND